MKNLTKGINLFLVILFMTGCSKVVIRSDSDPNINLAALKNFYVHKLPADERGVEKIIARKLNEFGFQATSGMDAIPADPVDAHRAAGGGLELDFGAWCGPVISRVDVSVRSR